MTDLGLRDFRLKIVGTLCGAFEWQMSFLLSAPARYYAASGTSPSPSQCFDCAMAYLAEMVRDAEGVEVKPE